MKTERLKIMHILNELMNFCYSQEGSNFNIQINEENKKTLIYLKCDVKNIEQEKLEEFKKNVNIERYHEIEECYWEIPVVNNRYEVTLLGVMVDSCEINYLPDKYIEFNIIRNK